MQEAIRFSDQEILTIHEDKKLPGVPKRNIRAIRIRREVYRDQHDPKIKPDIDGINALLGKLPNPEAVELFEIGYDCKIKVVPEIGRFNHIKFLHIGGSKVTNYDEIYRFNRLKRLLLISFKETDLSKFNGLAVEYLRMIRGKLVHCDAKMIKGFFQSCSNIESFQGATAQILNLEACKRVNPYTLAGVKGLECLVFNTSTTKATTSVDFIAGCKSLQSLAFYGASGKHIDFSGLSKCKSLKYLHAVISRDLQDTISRANPKLVVNNMVDYMRAGKTVNKKPLGMDKWDIY